MRVRVEDRGRLPWMALGAVCVWLVVVWRVAERETPALFHDTWEMARMREEAAAALGRQAPTLSPKLSAVESAASRARERRAVRAEEAEAAAATGGDRESLLLAKRRRLAVKNAFLHAYHGYERYAFGHDEVRPTTNATNDSWGGFGATLVDALDTMAIMKLKKELSRARRHVAQLDWDKDYGVSFFETTIRYLGGLLSAHSMTGHATFLNKAKELGDRLVRAFDASPSGMPKSIINLRTGASRNHQWNGRLSILAEVGSSQLEFAYLSHHTRNPIYAQKSRRVFERLERARHPVHPGLYNVYIDPETGEFDGEQRITLGSLADSFYEYTLKLYILSGGRDKAALRMFNNAVRGIREHLVFYETGKGPSDASFAFVGEVLGGARRVRVQEHLSCFVPGLFALAAMARIPGDRADYSREEVELMEQRRANLLLAKQLARGCVMTYERMPTGLGPESVDFSELVDDNGRGERGKLDVVLTKYMLRPETIESLFLLWRATGDAEYREMGWRIFTRIEEFCRTPAAFTGLRDVQVASKEAFNVDNSMQSFFLAETLKYLYLLFSPNSLLPLDKYVFNTEAHPLRVFS